MILNHTLQEVTVVAVPTPTPTSVDFLLAGSAYEPRRSAPWIRPLLALGSLTARYSRTMVARQLVIVISVPKRDYVAAMIGCGWILASEAPTLAEPLETLRRMKPGESLRAVNSQDVITGTFRSLNEAVEPPRAHFAGQNWIVDRIQALAQLPDGAKNARAPRPEPGSIGHMAGLDGAWDARLAQPAADLAIVGTATWLEEEFEASLCRENDTWSPTVLRSLLMPTGAKATTWFTRVYASARLADNLPIPQQINAVILDGNSAITYLNEIECPVVICVLDRSVAEETAAEGVIQLRNTRGEPVSLTDDIRWRPTEGLEAFGFTVPL